MLRGILLPIMRKFLFEGFLAMLKSLQRFLSTNDQVVSPKARDSQAMPVHTGANGTDRPEISTGGCDIELQHLWCEQPNALKLQLNRALLPLGQSRGFSKDDETSDSPLAQAVFTVPGIRAAVFESMAISVEMDDNADWEGIRDQLPLVIRKFFLAGGKPFIDQPTATDTGTMKKYSFGFKQVESRPREEQMQLVSELFEKEINPAVAAHGGFFKLLDIQDNNVYVELGGGCQGCSMANVTLRQGVEARLKEVLPEMTALIDSTDHASGNNPYFQGGKK